MSLFFALSVCRLDGNGQHLQSPPKLSNTIFLVRAFTPTEYLVIRLAGQAASPAANDVSATEFRFVRFGNRHGVFSQPRGVSWRFTATDPKSFFFQKKYRFYDGSFVTMFA